MVDVVKRDVDVEEALRGIGGVEDSNIDDSVSEVLVIVELKDLLPSTDKDEDGNISVSEVLVELRHPNTPNTCLLYTSPSPRDRQKSRMPSSA